MELVLVKNKGQIKVYQGVMDYHEQDYYFFATVTDGRITDMVVHTLSEDQMTIIPVPEYTKGALFDMLVDEYISVGV